MLFKFGIIKDATTGCKGDCRDSSPSSNKGVGRLTYHINPPPIQAITGQSYWNVALLGSGVVVETRKAGTTDRL